MTKKSKKLDESGKCWLCGKGRPNATILVGCDVPNGKKTRVHNVRVHFGCYMDMES